MRHSSYEFCPSTHELAAYFGADSPSEQGNSPAIAQHLDYCAECREIVQRLQAGNAKAVTSDPAHLRLHLSEGTRDVIDRQSARFREVIGLAEGPKVGEIWTTSISWRSSHLTCESERAALVLVLGTFHRYVSDSRTIDVVPVTEDPWFAADWSLIFKPAASDLGCAFVAHLDWQGSVSSGIFDRCVARLSERCLTDLFRSLSHFDRGDAAPESMECGEFGSAAIRTHADWREFSQELTRVTEELAASLDEESSDDEDLWTTADPVENADFAGTEIGATPIDAGWCSAGSRSEMVNFAGPAPQPQCRIADLLFSMLDRDFDGSLARWNEANGRSVQWDRVRLIYHEPADMALLRVRRAPTDLMSPDLKFLVAKVCHSTEPTSGAVLYARAARRQWPTTGDAR